MAELSMLMHPQGLRPEARGPHLPPYPATPLSR